MLHTHMLLKKLQVISKSHFYPPVCHHTSVLQLTSRLLTETQTKRLFSLFLPTASVLLFLWMPQLYILCHQIRQLYKEGMMMNWQDKSSLFYPKSWKWMKSSCASLEVCFLSLIVPKILQYNKSGPKALMSYRLQCECFSDSFFVTR